MKWVKRIAVVLVVLLLVVLVTAIFFLGSVVKNAAETVGPSVLGVEVKLADAKVFPLRGKIRLKGLLIGNPEGFKTPSMFEMGRLIVDVDMKSVFTDRVIIDRILIEAPKITMEGSLSGSNISALLDHLNEGAEDGADEKAPAEAEEAPAGEGKKIQINEFVLEDAQINLSLTMLGGKALSIPMPTIRKEGIGAGEGGASVVDLSKELIAMVYSGVLEAVKSSGALVGKAVGAASDLAVQGVGKAADVAADSAGKAVDAAAEGVGKAADVAVDGAGKAVDAAAAGVGKAAEVAGAGVGKATDAVGAGAKKITEGLGGLFKKGDDE